MRLGIVVITGVMLFSSITDGCTITNIPKRSGRMYLLPYPRPPRPHPPHRPSHRPELPTKHPKEVNQQTPFVTPTKNRASKKQLWIKYNTNTKTKGKIDIIRI